MTEQQESVVKLLHEQHRDLKRSKPSMSVERQAVAEVSIALDNIVSKFGEPSLRPTVKALRRYMESLEAEFREADARTAMMAGLAESGYEAKAAQIVLTMAPVFRLLNPVDATVPARVDVGERSRARAPVFGTCFSCKQPGHFMRDCPMRSESAPRSRGRDRDRGPFCGRCNGYVGHASYECPSIIQAQRALLAVPTQFTAPPPGLPAR